MQYLRVLARFHRYSTNNTILIFLQKPDALYLHRYTTWKDQFNRHVKKGEKGIRLFAPVNKPTSTLYKYHSSIWRTKGVFSPPPVAAKCFVLLG